MFKCVFCEAAGATDASGFQAAFDPTSFKASMENTKQHACGGNLAWIKIGYSTSPGVPYNQNSIRKLKEFYFSSEEAPQRFPGLVIVGVSLLQVKDGILGERGAMEAVSPPELVHAFIFRLSELIDEKMSDVVLDKWLKVMLPTMFVFELLPTFDAKSARTDSLREAAVSEYHGFAWTVLQKVYHLGLFRVRKEKELGSLSASRVATLYNEDWPSGHVDLGLVDLIEPLTH